MTRWLMVVLASLVLIAQLADRVYLRTMTAAKDVEAVSVKEGRVFKMDLETQEIVNDESVMLFSENALVVLFNYRPGLARDHVDSEQVRKLFINDDAHQTFRREFLAWSAHEFNVNNISIKEAITHSGTLLTTPKTSLGGSRIWRYSARLPMTDRGVGSSGLAQLKAQLFLVYLGPEGGMGIYKVKLTL